MIKQVIDINGYWKVIVYYNVNYNLFSSIYDELVHVGIHNKTIKRIYNNMVTHRAKAVTISNINKQISIILFNKHKNKYDYINSIVHEAEHVKQDILKAYHIKDKGESPAYTIGYIVMQMLKFLNVLK